MSFLKQKQKVEKSIIGTDEELEAIEKILDEDFMNMTTINNRYIQASLSYLLTITMDNLIRRNALQMAIQEKFGLTSREIELCVDRVKEAPEIKQLQKDTDDFIKNILYQEPTEK